MKPNIMPEKVVPPFPICTLWKLWAKFRYFKNFLHIQEPALFESLTDQIQPSQRSILLIHNTQREFLFETTRQISFRKLTTFAFFRGLNPKPPSSFMQSLLSSGSAHATQSLLSSGSALAQTIRMPHTILRFPYCIDSGVRRLESRSWWCLQWQIEEVVVFQHTIDIETSINSYVTVLSQ